MDFPSIAIMLHGIISPALLGDNMRRVNYHIIQNLFCIIAFATLCACTPKRDAADSSDAAQISDIARTYTQLTRLTKSPVRVDARFSMLCRGMTPEEADAMVKKSGPHADAAINIYMSDLAATAFDQASAAYPVGAIIVKEKLSQSAPAAPQPGDAPPPIDGVGGMIKRPSGYDPAHDDWEYFYFEDPAKIQSGKIESCIQCHAGAATKDYVFGTWMTKK
jgi:hypothetical protein